MNDLISRQAAIDVTWEEPSYTDALNVLTEVRDKVKALPSVNPQEPKTGWIPIKTRPLTNKEKEEYADLGYSEDSISSMYDCPLPEDGEEVLITTLHDEVTTDTFYRDEGCYFETYCDEDDVKAWMSKPKPYKAEGEIHCTYTDSEIAKSFIDDVEAVKDLLSKAESEEKK